MMSDQALTDLRRYVEEALACRATDVFLVPDEPPTCRVDGIIQRTDAEPLDADAIARMAAAAVGEQKADSVGVDAGSVHGRVRLSDSTWAAVTVSRSMGQLTLVARPVRTFQYKVHDLRVPQAMVEAVESPHGLVLVTGPMGCGKTTTAFALLDHLNATRDLHIISTGYHLEYILEPKRSLIQQRQIGVDVPDMLSGIQSAMQQGLDVLFVGEIRSVEVMQACLTAAEWGHTVLTQLHQPTPELAIQRMIDPQPAETVAAFRGMLARLLKGVLAQYLLPKASGKGMVAAYGLLIPDGEMQQAICEGRDVLDRAKPLPTGCQSLADDIIRLRDEGIVTAEASQEALESIGSSRPT